MVLSPTIKGLITSLGILCLMILCLGFTALIIQLTPWYSLFYKVPITVPFWLKIPFSILSWINSWIYYIIFGLNYVYSLSAIIGAPILEELEWRGPLYLINKKYNLSEKTKIILSSLSSLLFAMWHGLSIIGTINITIVGLVLSWLIFKTKKLWCSISVHSLYNLLVTLIR